MTGPSRSPDFEPDLVLLLCGDPGDPVTRALVQNRSQLGWPLTVISTEQLLDDVELGEAWTVSGRRAEPDRTAIINRLPMADRLEPNDTPVAAAIGRQALWSRLHDDLSRFRYASSLPTATSIMGCYGS